MHRLANMKHNSRCALVGISSNDLRQVRKGRIVTDIDNAPQQACDNV